MALRIDEQVSKNKQTYQILNWKSYNQALVNRGRLILWFEEESLQQWYTPQKTGKSGASKTYSDVAIQCGESFEWVREQMQS